MWDRRTWESIGDPREGMKEGKLDFLIHGEKLHGKFRHVRLAAKDDDRGKQNWLFMKGTDEHVRDGEEVEIVKRQPGSVLTGRTIEDLKNGVPAATTRKKPLRKAKGAPPKRRPVAAKLARPGATKVQLATLVDAVPPTTRGSTK